MGRKDRANNNAKEECRLHNLGCCSASAVRVHMESAAKATAPTSSSSRASPSAKHPRRDRHLRRKPAGKPRPELWETSKKCRHGHVNEIFCELGGGNGPAPRNSGQRPVASARTAVKEQRPLRGAPLVPRSAPLTASSLRLPSLS